jgi:1-deoxy-D-xylulose-5-phosphate reductoisomerase
LSQIRNVAVLGSTGSIGRAAIDVLQRLRSTHRVTAISCHSQLDLLESQIGLVQPRYAIVTKGMAESERTTWQGVQHRESPATERLVGADAVNFLVSSRGNRGRHRRRGDRRGRWAGKRSRSGAKAGKRLALANKESLGRGGFADCCLHAAERTSGAEVLTGRQRAQRHLPVLAVQSQGSQRSPKRIILTGERRATAGLACRSAESRGDRGRCPGPILRGKWDVRSRSTRQP